MDSARLFLLNIQVESDSHVQLYLCLLWIKWKTPVLFVGQVSKLSYAAPLDLLTYEEKVNHCTGYNAHYPSQKVHSCHMMDSEPEWIPYFQTFI